MTHADVLLLWRILAAAGLAFALGFERELRGAPAGDRTFALIGVTAAAVTAVTIRSSPQAVAGVVTGVGFVGGAFVFRSESGELRGITSAATMFAVAGIGIAAGAGHVVLAALVTLVVLVDLELRHLPVLRVLDARRYSRNMAPEDMPDDVGGRPLGD
jgi:putative Mg2+ transporter-C (MgtC) family protein